MECALRDLRFRLGRGYGLSNREARALAEEMAAACDACARHGATNRSVRPVTDGVRRLVREATDWRKAYVRDDGRRVMTYDPSELLALLDEIDEAFGELSGIARPEGGGDGDGGE